MVYWLLFIGYLAVITYFMFFSDGFGRTDQTDYAYNLVLFREITRFYKYRELLGMKAFLMNTVGNVVCFMPFGFILPLISRRCGRWHTVQLVFKVGSFDVDDMFLNTIGGIAGYLCLMLCRGIRRLMDGASKR